ncbi:hypothetical protein Fmac_001567 [Flemingia macrophylla]|uniref:Uncharacterized protein n=1 Tax=Flemingia macrophylla TaxID=520843 RepID=A0ABD1NIR3_9FABA
MPWIAVSDYCFYCSAGEEDTPSSTVVMLHITCKFSSRFLSQSNLLIACTIDLYSASLEDFNIVVCFLVF